MTTYTTEIHLKERQPDQVYGRTFEGWLVGCTDCFPTLTQKFAMTSEQAIRWCVEVENAAWDWSEAKKSNMDGSPSFNRIETKRIYENF